MKGYQVHYWTESGGVSRSDYVNVDTPEKVKKNIYNDLIDFPYGSFWYGEYIDIKNLDTGKEVQIYTHDKDCPIKMKLTIHEKTYYNIEEIKNDSKVDEISDDEEYEDIFEIVTDGLFQGGELVSSNDDLTETTLIFTDDNGNEFYLEYKIDYSFLNEINNKLDDMCKNSQITNLLKEIDNILDVMKQNYRDMNEKLDDIQSSLDVIHSNLEFIQSYTNK